MASRSPSAWCPHERRDERPGAGPVSPAEFDALRRLRLRENLAALPRKASARLALLWGALAWLWTEVLTDDQRLSVLAHSPLPNWSWPIVATASIAIAHVYPQRSFLPPVDADAELRSTQ